MKKLMGAVIPVLVISLLVLPPTAAESRLPREQISGQSGPEERAYRCWDIQFRVTSATLVYTPTGSLGTLQHSGRA